MKIIKNKNIYETYQKILPSFKDLIKKNSENPSPYWAEEVIGFDYIFEASPLIINKLKASLLSSHWRIPIYIQEPS